MSVWVIVLFLVQAVTLIWQGLLYVLPSEPHTRLYSIVQNLGQTQDGTPVTLLQIALGGEEQGEPIWHHWSKTQNY